MFMPALILATLYWLIEYFDSFVSSWQCLSRPIVICPLVGLILGDVQTGCLMGASLESLFMGISAIGGSLPADPASASYIVTAFAILSGADMESAIAIAMPIGTIMATVVMMPFNLLTPIQGFYSKLLQENKIKEYQIAVYLITAFQMFCSGCVLFVCIYFGVDVMETVLAALPAWFMTGLDAISCMALAVGFAILASQIMTKETVVWFFVGFILAKVLELDTLSIAIIGIAIAITIFLIEKKIIDNKVVAVAEEEEFF